MARGDDAAAPGGADRGHSPSPQPVRSAWPPPHPSPPLPAPREYGVPGTAPSRGPWLIGVVAAVLVVVVVVVLVLVLGGDDEPESQASDDETTSGSAAPSETAAAAASYTCWDGATAASLEECTAPTGAAGLAWVFPAIAGERCGEARAAGAPGVVTRVLCISRLGDGTKIQVGYFEWASVEQGLAFYDEQGLTRTEATDVIVRWASADGDQAKSATMYAAEPYSITITYPDGAEPSAEDVAALQPRPATEVRGVPAS